MKASIDELLKTARIYQKSSSRIEEIAQELDKSTKALADNWSSVKQQSFFEYHKELIQYLDGCAEIMNAIAREIRKTAERYEEADTKYINQEERKGD